MSSKGVGACALDLGGLFKWSGYAEAFLGCDLKDSVIAITSSLPGIRDRFGGGRAAAAQLGGAMAQRVTVRRGLPAISFEVDASGGAPTLTLTDPRGRRYVDDGEPFQRRGKLTVLRLEEENRTLLKVKGSPPGGMWTVAAQPGSPAITRVETREGLPPTRVLARVRGRGAGRRLAYSVAPVPGQTVTFYEHGATVGRAIGVARGRRGALRFPKGHGTAGRRRIFAIVTQDGMPRDKIQLTSYVAPRPPRVRTPRRLRARAGRRHVSLRWQPVPSAARYHVTVKAGDGRLIDRDVSRPSLRFSQRRGLPASVTVAAMARDGRESRPARLKVKAKRQRIVIRL